MRGGRVYIMTNELDGALYTGVTSNIARRAFERREGLIDGFTRRYGLKRLVLTEFYEDIARRDSAREQHQALAARLEGAPHPRRESRMA
jgi:putative endonuclease